MAEASPTWLGLWGRLRREPADNQNQYHYQSHPRRKETRTILLILHRACLIRVSRATTREEANENHSYRPDEEIEGQMFEKSNSRHRCERL